MIYERDLIFSYPEYIAHHFIIALAKTTKRILLSFLSIHFISGRVVLLLYFRQMTFSHGLFI